MLVLQGHTSSVAQSLVSKKRRPSTQKQAFIEGWVKVSFISMSRMLCSWGFSDWRLSIRTSFFPRLGNGTSVLSDSGSVTMCPETDRTKGLRKVSCRNGQPVSNSYLFFNAVLLIASKLHLNLTANNQWHLFYIWFHRYEAIGCEDLNVHTENGQILLKSKWSPLCSQLRGYVTDKKGSTLWVPVMFWYLYIL